MNELTELVLDLVAQIPAGRVSTYGTVADAARALCGAGSARIIGQIMAQFGDQVPWWRVVNAAGECAPHLRQQQFELLKKENVTFTRIDPPRVALKQHLWVPE